MGLTEMILIGFLIFLSHRNT